MQERKRNTLFIFIVILLVFTSSSPSPNTQRIEGELHSERLQKIELEEFNKLEKEKLDLIEKLEIEKVKKKKSEEEERKKQEEERIRLEEIQRINQIEENRLNSVQLPIQRDLYWISSEHGSIEDVRNYTAHDGTDFAASMWTPVKPIAKGRVVFSGWYGVWGGCGAWVAIRHDQYGIDSIYCHLADSPPVSVGQEVSVDTIIGYVGSTGWSTGPHLHLGMYPHSGGGWYGGSTIDARYWLLDHGVAIS